jgi:uncharacterized ferredoxin-like protein
MKYKGSEIETEAVMNVARTMCAAARTAPKAKGVDNLSILLIDGDDIEKLAKKMIEIGNAIERYDFFIRDAKGVLQSTAIVMIGTSFKSVGLDCGFCGTGSCSEKELSINRCTFNVGDLGIAIGSAVSLAARNHIDNRVMFSCGYAALKLGLFDESVKVAYGIPLSVSGKNIFFDRKHNA